MWGLRGTRRGLLRRVLGAPRVEVYNGCPRPSEPGRTECVWVRRSWLSCAILLGHLIAVSMLNSESMALGVKGVGDPTYGVLLGAVGRARGCRGRELKCTCISTVKSYSGAEGDRKVI